MRLERFLKPAIFLLVPVATSIGVWLVPGQSAALRGFARRSELTFASVAILVAWYTLCFAVIWVSGRIGRRVRTFQSLEQFESSPALELHLYWFLTALSVVGTVAAIITIAENVSIWNALVTRNANLLAEALPGRPGIATLRYTTAIAAPLGAYLWQQKRAPVWAGLLNIALLIVSVTLASRLSLIVAVFVFAFLLARTSPTVRLRIWTFVVGAIVLVGSLTAFNYLRNGNFYEQNGVHNPILMNAFQIAGYLGAPGQVSIGVADGIVDGRLEHPGAPISSLGAVVPSFLVFDKSVLQNQTVAERYGKTVSIAENFNANSAFGDTYGVFGWWGLVYIALGLAIAAFAFGIFFRYRSVVAIIPAVLLYGFAEFWRLFLFNQGIYIFLILATAGGIAFALFVPKASRRWSAL